MVPVRPASWTLNQTALWGVSTYIDGMWWYVRGVRHVVVAARSRALGHVSDRRTHVAIRPESPEEVDLRASSDLSLKRGRLRANDAALSVAAALQVGRGDILDRPVALDLTRDALGCGARVRVLVWLVESVRLVANGGVVDVAVAGDGRGECESSSDVSHCESGKMYDPAYDENW